MRRERLCWACGAGATAYAGGYSVCRACARKALAAVGTEDVAATVRATLAGAALEEALAAGGAGLRGAVEALETPGWRAKKEWLAGPGARAGALEGRKVGTPEEKAGRAAEKESAARGKALGADERKRLLGGALGALDSGLGKR